MASRYSPAVCLGVDPNLTRPPSLRDYPCCFLCSQNRFPRLTRISLVLKTTPRHIQAYGNRGGGESKVRGVGNIKKILFIWHPWDKLRINTFAPASSSLLPFVGDANGKFFGVESLWHRSKKKILITWKYLNARKHCTRGYWFPSAGIILVCSIGLHTECSSTKADVFEIGFSSILIFKVFSSLWGFFLFYRFGWNGYFSKAYKLSFKHFKY